MNHEEAEERLRSGWHVEPPLLDLIERDYDSPQRKRFVRSEKARLCSLLERQGLGA